MADFLNLGAKVYRPNLCATGNPKHVGTREMQLILLKDLLLLGGAVRYGQRIVGLAPPLTADGSTRWRAGIEPYVLAQHDAAEKVSSPLQPQLPHTSAPYYLSSLTLPSPCSPQAPTLSLTANLTLALTPAGTRVPEAQGVRKGV